MTPRREQLLSLLLSFGIWSSRLDSALDSVSLHLCKSHFHYGTSPQSAQSPRLHSPFAHGPPSELSFRQLGSVLGGPLSSHPSFITLSSLTVQVWFFCHAQQTHAYCGNIEPHLIVPFHYTLFAQISGITTIRGHVLFFSSPFFHFPLSTFAF
ncbi:hypothetical protein BGW80DRAFT_674805 [Lactifluus volemus]|nr:hypothetical protein BGW80DRAFT_674805 [Lactifluus volemus]